MKTKEVLNKKMLFQQLQCSMAHIAKELKTGPSAQPIRIGVMRSHIEQLVAIMRALKHGEIATDLIKHSQSHRLRAHEDVTRLRELIESARKIIDDWCSGVS